MYSSGGVVMRTIDDIESNSMSINSADYIVDESAVLIGSARVEPVFDRQDAFGKMYAKKKALEEYARHKKTCESYLQHRVDGKIVGCQCTCGLDELLK